MYKDFEIYICSYLDYEDMVADVRYKGVTFGTLNQEKGKDQMEIEIRHPPKGAAKWDFPLDGFVKTLLEAKNILIKMEKIEEE